MAQRFLDNPNQLKLVILVLLVLSIVLVVELVSADSNSLSEEDQAELTEEAVKYGYEQAIFQMMNEVSKCAGPLPVFGDNVTLNIVAVECIQAAQAQQAANQN